MTIAGSSSCSNVDGTGTSASFTDLSSLTTSPSTGKIIVSSLGLSTNYIPRIKSVVLQGLIQYTTG